MSVYRGETIIENVERLPDGTSHLLLRIDDDNDLIVDAKNPNKIKGKYKYRFKRIGVVSSNSNEVAAMALPKKTQTQTTINNVDSHVHAPLDSNNKNKLLDKAIIDQVLDQDTSLSSSSSSSSLGNENKMPTFSEKRKLFENKAALSLNEPSNVALNVTTAPSIAPNVAKSNKVLDLIKQLNQSSSIASTSKSNKQNDDDDDDGCDEENDNDSKEEHVENEQEENDEYNVANENTVTKVTKAKQKRVKQETTVVIEEKYVINDESEEVAKSSKAGNQNQKVGFIFFLKKEL